MNNVWKSIAAVVAGLVLTVGLIWAIELISWSRHPLPEGVDMDDLEAMKKHIATLPWDAFVTVLAAYFVGTSAGSWLATRFGPNRLKRHGVVVGLLALAAGVMNFVSIPHPTWFAIACVLVFPLATILGIGLARRREIPHPG